MPPSRGRAPVRRSTNNDLSDREMLANIEDAAGPDGWATTTDIAIACGFTGAGGKSQTPAIKVASRLSYMRAGKLLESTGPDPHAKYTEPGSRDTRWRLTAVGKEIRGGALSKAVQNAIERMDAGTQVLMMRQLTQRGWVEGDLPVAFALRRQYQNVVSQRQIVFRGSKR